MANIKNPFNTEYDPSTVLIATPGYFIGKMSERLIIKKNKKIVAEIPLISISQILIMSRGNSISTTLINEMTKRGIKICIWAGNLPNIVISSPQLAAFVEAKRAQFKAYDNQIGLELVKDVVKSKISNQANLLKYASKNRKEDDGYRTLTSKIAALGGYVEKVGKIDGHNINETRTDILSLEAHAAKIYWDCFGALLRNHKFAGRITRGDIDPVNAALNYSYAILYSITWMSIMNAGLEAFAGFSFFFRDGPYA